MAKRKIPARKHHGIRDPVKQHEARLAKIKDKINNPPETGGQQKIPNSLANFIKLKDQAKSGKPIKLKRFINNEDKPKPSKKNPSVRPYKEVQPIKQFPDESDEDYLRRVNRITSESLKEAEYEIKYGVDIIRDPETGKITVKKRPKDKLSELNKKNSKDGKVKKKTKPLPKVSKELIKQVLKEEKQKAKEVELEEYKRDTIKFGEVVHAPPTLSILPRRAEKLDTVPRPGKKDNLLLKNILKGSKDNTSENVLQKSKKLVKKCKKADLKGKRKDLPHATRRMLENQQNKAIEMYRNLKKSKMKSRNIK